VTVSRPDGAPAIDSAPGLPLAALLALATAAFVDVVTDLLPAGLLPQMGHGLHVPQARVGLLVSAFAVASAAAAIPVTTALRGLPRRAVLVTVLAGFALTGAVTAASSSFALTVVVRLAAGIMGGTLWSMLAGYAARMVPECRRGRAVGIVLAGITAALCLGLPAGTALAGLVGWRASFALLACVAAGLAAWAWRRLPDFPGEAAAGRVPLRGVAARPGIRPLLVVTFLLLTGHQAMYTYIAPFTGHAGFGRTGLVLLVFGVATVAGVAAASLLADRRLWPALVAALAIVVAAMAALGQEAGIPAVLLLSTGLWGAAFGGAPTLLQTALVNASGPDHADVVTSMQTTVYNIGIAAGSLAGSLILQHAGPGALPWAASLLATGALASAALTAVTTARRGHHMR
jgi:predicted MFS family arabinose efflux permease